MKSKSQPIIELLKSVGAVLTNDHFVLTTGKHSDTYINKDALYPHTDKASQVGKMFADHCQDLDIEVVVAPALGGIILSQWTAHHLSQLKKKEVLGVYAEKGPDKSFIFTRGYDKLIGGKKILVLEDLTTTGGSVKKVVDAVRQAGGEVVMVGVMVNRNPEQVNEVSMTAPFFSLGSLEVKAYAENEVPVELAQRPINTHVGHGKKYLEAKKVNL
jgi:orotate phosphoribosyltransferase